MKPIHELMHDVSSANKALGEANVMTKAALREMNKPLEKLFEAYCATFEALAERASEFDYKIPEFDHHGFADGSRWGNNGLCGITPRENGFTEILTNDHFRNEASTVTAYLPTKYLCEGGEQLMADDAARIDAELKQLEQNRDKERAEAAEMRDRAEFERLQKKFNKADDASA